MSDRPPLTPRPHTRPPVQLAEVAPLVPPREFLDAAAGIGIEFEPGDLERLGHYLALLLETNKSVNLTGVTDPAQAWTQPVEPASAERPIAPGSPRHWR